MFIVFLLQLASGCLFMLAISNVRLIAWRYLRLMGVVALAAAMLAGVLHVRESGWSGGPAVIALGAIGAALALAYLFVNAVQSDRVSGSQRVWAAAAGAALFAAAGRLAVESTLGAAKVAAALASLFQGAAIIGAVTAGMLLGHRYLTETGMTIAPLRRLSTSISVAVGVRAAWIIAMWWPSRGDLAAAGQPREWMIMLLTVRIGVGIVMVGIFAYMIRDCVRRRSTQSATGILYLTMVLVFLGELMAQYLWRTTGVPL